MAAWHEGYDLLQDIDLCHMYPHMLSKLCTDKAAVAGWLYTSWVCMRCCRNLDIPSQQQLLSMPRATAAVSAALLRGLAR